MPLKMVFFFPWSPNGSSCSEKWDDTTLGIDIYHYVYKQ